MSFRHGTGTRTPTRVAPVDLSSYEGLVMGGHIIGKCRRRMTATESVDNDKAAPVSRKPADGTAPGTVGHTASSCTAQPHSRDCM